MKFSFTEGNNGTAYCVHNRSNTKPGLNGQVFKVCGVIAEEVSGLISKQFHFAFVIMLICL